MRYNLYSDYFERIGNGRSLIVHVVAKYDRIFQLFEGEKMYCCVENENGMEIIQDKAFEEKIIPLPIETQWVVEISNGTFYQIYITEWTKNLQTPFEERINRIINQKVKEVQEAYQKKKKEEKRLYWYQAGKDKLELYTDGLIYLKCGEKYDLGSDLQAIDKRFPIPKKDCFLLGRVCRTIVTKKRKLLDFVEPIAEFTTDSKAIEGLFYDEKRGLGNILLRMLLFSIQKQKNEPIELVDRQIKKETNKSVQDFIKELKTALETGDIEKIKAFDEIVNPICYN